MSNNPPVLLLDVKGVQQLFTSSLGLPQYCPNLAAHNISGDILVHLDDDALQEIGINSIGHRLAILSHVYRLKVEQGIEVEEGEYVPPYSEPTSPDKNTSETRDADLLDLIREQASKLNLLEGEISRLRNEVGRPSRATPDSASPTAIVTSPTNSTVQHSQHSGVHPLSNAAMLTQSQQHKRPGGGSSRTGTSSSNATATGSSSIDFYQLYASVEEEEKKQNAGTYLTTGEVQKPSTSPVASSYVASSSLSGPYARPATTTTAPSPFPKDRIPQRANSTRGPSAFSTAHYQGQAPAPAQAQGYSLSSSSSQQQQQQQHHNYATPHAYSTMPQQPPTSQQTPGQITLGSLATLNTPSSSSKATQTSANSPDNPYRSFRVTVDDPCFKVLPAALKKYKINDDWRRYALFICYFNTERCLAYDEKPLLLFQRLKENKANPVFMLRNIKDIKSPIEAAKGKMGRGGKRRLSGAPRRLADASGSALSPEVFSPDSSAMVVPPATNANAVVGESGTPGRGFCIAIYPYVAERDDELNVTVGDTFIVTAKTKGWWVVRPDYPGMPEPTGPNAFWVPAGCLLEISAPAYTMTSPEYPTTSSILLPPAVVVSMSTPSLALMDFVAKGEDELSVTKGTLLRIFKRYNYWSYAIKDDGTRGWIPSWFCGKYGDSPKSPTKEKEKEKEKGRRGAE